MTANMTSFLQFGVQPPTLARVVPIPKGELRVLNTDPHHQREKSLVSIPTPQKEIMLVHPELMEGQPWTTVTNKKSKGKRKKGESSSSVPTEEEESCPNLRPKRKATQRIRALILKE